MLRAATLCTMIYFDPISQIIARVDQMLRRMRTCIVLPSTTVGSVTKVYRSLMQAVKSHELISPFLKP